MRQLRPHIRGKDCRWQVRYRPCQLHARVRPAIEGGGRDCQLHAHISAARMHRPAMEGGGHLSFNAEYNIQHSDSGWRQVDLGSLGSSERLPLTSKSGQMVKCCHLEADHQKLTRSCQGVTRISDADGSKCCHLEAGRPLSESAHSGQKLPSE